MTYYCCDHTLSFPWCSLLFSSPFFFKDPAPTDIYTLSLHDALPISLTSQPSRESAATAPHATPPAPIPARTRSEEHTSELQSRGHLVCRLLLEKKKIRQQKTIPHQNEHQHDTTQNHAQTAVDRHATP